LNDMVYSNCSL